MKKQSTDMSRRSLLKGFVAIPVAAVAAGFQTSAHAAPMVSVDDPMAKALGYTEKSAVDGKSCANCQLYSGTGGASGPCTIFPGKEVAATGYCNSWVAKA
jgi:hypothetical protein